MTSTKLWSFALILQTYITLCSAVFPLESTIWKKTANNYWQLIWWCVVPLYKVKQTILDIDYEIKCSNQRTAWFISGECVPDHPMQGKRDEPHSHDRGPTNVAAPNWGNTALGKRFHWSIFWINQKVKRKSHCQNAPIKEFKSQLSGLHAPK